MMELGTAFDERLWRWELGTGVGPGPAGVASVELAEGVIAHADALDQRLLGIVVDASDSGGVLTEVEEDTLRSLGLSHPLVGGSSRIHDDVASSVARLALLNSESERSEATGPSSDAWASEADKLRRDLGLPTEFDDDVPVALAGLSDAQSAFSALPPVIGGVAENGPVWVDPSWLTPGVMDVRRTWTAVVPGAGLLSVGTRFREGIYVAAVTGISAMVVEDSTGVVVGASSFAPDGDAERLGASSQVVIGRGRPPGTLSLWLTSQGGRPPSAKLRVSRQATELARRAAQAGRLGMSELARPLLQQSSQLWRSIGRTQRADVDLPTSDPFAGEVADLASLLEDGSQ